MKFALLLAGYLFFGANSSCLPSNSGCQKLLVDYTSFGFPGLTIEAVSWQWNCNPSTGEWQTLSYRDVTDCSGTPEVTVGVNRPNLDS